MSVAEDSREFWRKQEEQAHQEAIDTQLDRLDKLLGELDLALMGLKIDESVDIGRFRQLRSRLATLSTTIDETIRHAEKDD